MTHSHQLLSLLARTSFKLGQFKLSSGGTSDYYIDCRTTTLHAEGGRLTGHAILDLLEQNNIQAEAVGGLTMGADPIVSNVATASAWRAQQHPGSPLLHGFLVRKAEKAHGTGRRIEGFCREGARVIIVDDVCTTGASTIAAIEAAREANMIVAAVVCIVEREEANGRPAVEAAAAAGAPDDRSSSTGWKSAPFLRLFSANDVRAEHIGQQGSAANDAS
ncbi:MAG TPA: orotate phosphoribosyltransferase [Terracidiphilus sp.]|jgi:orotate phosphoribosyltransferase